MTFIFFLPLAAEEGDDNSTENAMEEGDAEEEENVNSSGEIDGSPSRLKKTKKVPETEKMGRILVSSGNNL